MIKVLAFHISAIAQNLNKFHFLSLFGILGSHVVRKQDSFLRCDYVVKSITMEWPNISTLHKGNSDLKT
jgi:hypothetical protein